MRHYTLTTQIDLHHNLNFIVEAINATAIPGDSPQKVFHTLLFRIGSDDFAVWMQTTDEKIPVGFASGFLVIDIHGQLACWLWLVYGKPGAKLQEAFNALVVPWARDKGAAILQTGNRVYTPAKARWFEKFGMRKSFEVYERNTWDKMP